MRVIRELDLIFIGTIATMYEFPGNYSDIVHYSLLLFCAQGTDEVRGSTEGNES